LNATLEDNKECLDYLDFSKEFAYNLKSDGMVVSQHYDQVNKVEVNCKRVAMDGDCQELLDKIAKCLINN
jgi:hypothetical protein